MEYSLARLAGIPSPSTFYPSLIPARNRKRPVRLRARLNEEGDPFYQSAVRAASLRFQETQRSGPLFLDPYAGCFASCHDGMGLIVEGGQRHPYCVATKFIDDKLLHDISLVDGLKQVVLLTDGMDTRPYRLNWPTSTIIFDISPERVFKEAADKLEDVGAKVPRSCLSLHIPLESSDVPLALRSKGFNGNRLSVWVMQGIPLLTLANLKEILSVISSMIANGCHFIGELPTWLVETEIGIEPNVHQWISKLFMSHGFRVEIISYEDSAGDLGLELMPLEYKKLLFIAEQLQFSDDQMEAWRREFQRVEEEGDEEGFEEL